jgi:hypothetical protein
VITTSQDPAGPIPLLLEGLMNDVEGHVAHGWVPIPVIKLVWKRLRRLKARFVSTMARFLAGTLPAPGSDVPARPARVRPAAASPPAEVPPWLRIPTCSGWLIQRISWFLMSRYYDLEELLEKPEVAASVAEAPQLGRVLRPMCHMLGVKQPDWLRRPPRPRRPRVVIPPPPPPDWLVNEPGAILHSDGTVWMRLGASTKWRPGGPETLEEVQKFDRPRQIWPHRD